MVPFVVFQMLRLVFGIVLLTAVSLWSPRPGKKIFVSFAIVGLVFGAVFEMAMTAVIDAVYGYSAYSVGTVLEWCLTIVSFSIYFVSGWLLTLFVVSQNKIGEYDTELQQYQLSDPRPNRLIMKWDTESTGHEQVKILRKREWALLIECAPLIISFVVFFFVLAQAQATGRPSWTPAILGWIFLLVLIGTGIYLPIRDSLEGMGIGKRLTDCRVVDLSSGEPIQLPQSLARNFLLVIPLFAFVEVLVASFRTDRRRIGDLLAGTTVVSGPPRFIDGIEQPRDEDTETEMREPAKHPLDD